MSLGGNICHLGTKISKPVELKVARIGSKTSKSGCLEVIEDPLPLPPLIPGLFWLSKGDNTIYWSLIQSIYCIP